MLDINPNREGETQRRGAREQIEGVLRRLMVAGVVVGLICLCFGVPILNWIGDWQAAERRDVAAAQARDVALAALPTETATLDTLLSEADAALQKRDHGAALAVLGEANTIITRWSDAGIVSETVMAPRTAAVEARYAHARALQALVDGQWRARSAKDPLGADDIYGAAITSLVGLPADYLLADTIPPLVKDLESARRSIAKAVARARKEDDKTKALRAACGTAPERDTWDGGIAGLDFALRQSAHDPGSIDTEDCTAPTLTRSCWYVECTVRGKNAFGAKTGSRTGYYMAHIGSGPMDFLVEEAG